VLIRWIPKWKLIFRDVNMGIRAGMYFSQERTLGKLLTQVPKNINSKNNSVTEKLAEEGY